jgi:hypothetical protein
MTIVCHKCNGIFKDNYDLQRHLKRKRDCSKIIKLNFEYSNMNKLVCNYCQRKFVNNSTLVRHLRDSCNEYKKIKGNNNNNNNNKTNEGHHNIINCNKNNINSYNVINSNNTNYGINILPFGQENLKNITFLVIERILKENMILKYSVWAELIEAIHCDPSIPENQNIEVSNVHPETIKIYDGKLNKKITADKILETLRVNSSLIMQKKIIEYTDKLTKELKDAYSRTEYEMVSDKKIEKKAKSFIIHKLCDFKDNKNKINNNFRNFKENTDNKNLEDYINDDYSKYNILDDEQPEYSDYEDYDDNYKICVDLDEYTTIEYSDAED